MSSKKGREAGYQGREAGYQGRKEGYQGRMEERKDIKEGRHGDGQKEGNGREGKGE